MVRLFPSSQSVYLLYLKFTRILGLTIYTIKSYRVYSAIIETPSACSIASLEKYCGGDPTLVSEEKILFCTVFDGDFDVSVYNSIRVSQVW